MKNETLAVSELYPSFQGEGPFMGRLAYFLRLKNCRFNCKFCDTAKIWRKGEDRTFEQIYTELQNFRQASVLVITGGSPMLQQESVGDFIYYLSKQGMHVFVQIEDEGVIPVTFTAYLNQVIHFVVSPKLSNSGIPREKAIKENVLKWHIARPESQFKFVIGNEKDWTEAFELVTRFQIPAWRVWLMPKARTVEQYYTLAPKIARMALDAGVNFSSRLHLTLDLP